ncbi:hypothetical protein THOM_1682 [Trachipleistophora hominis]|uniref:Uncharacterized protein n=1 Tax=Trachipleistophora hominis TaxID=72359 RepID=L7JVQ5_TRAHO|nr:hypothetical protein THOM_1682 [Trachipleistophora hominis]
MKIFKGKEPDKTALCDELSILNNRLTASSYLEDRVAAINSLKEIVEKSPNEVGIYSMASVIESMQHFVHRDHFEVLSSIFRSSNGQEFQEIFLKVEKYVQILINARNKRGTDILTLLAMKDYTKVSRAFTSNEKFFTYFKKMDEKAFKLIDILIRDIFFRMKLVDNGIFESIFKMLHEHKHVKPCFSTISNLLRDSFEVQDHFYDLEWKKNLEPYCNTNPHYFFNVLESLLDTRNTNFTRMQADLNDIELANKALEMKRYDFVHVFFYNRVGLDVFMKHVDYYGLFLRCERRKELLKIYFLVNTPFEPNDIDLNNDFTCYFLACHRYKKFYGGISAAKIVSELLETSLKIKTDEQEPVQKEIDYSEDKANDKNDTSHLFDDDDEIATEEFYTKINLTSSTAIQKDVQLPEHDLIDECQHELQKINERSTFFVIGMLILLNITKTKVLLNESHINVMLALLRDDMQSTTVKGLVALLIDEHALRDNNEENLIFYMHELRKYFCGGQNVLHENVNDLFVLLITERCKALQDKIGGRVPVSLSTEHKMHENEAKKTNTSDESEGHRYKNSPKDVFRTIMSNVSSKFTTSDEEDSFNL